jgi:spore germination cell wall hydrolase CwlJ-like protein
MKLIADYLFGIVTVFQEAEGESYEGKRAVAEVIQRRTKRKFMSDGTVIGTVMRRLQFSGMNSDAANRIRSFQIDTTDKNTDMCVRAWVDAGRGPDIVPDCMHYYNPHLVSPAWAEGATVVAEIGNHRFIITKEGK